MIRKIRRTLALMLAVLLSFSSITVYAGKATQTDAGAGTKC